MCQSQFIPPPPFLLGVHMFVLSACLLSYLWGWTICSLAKTSSSICIHQIIPPLTTEGYHSSSSLPCLRHHQYFLVTGLFPLGHMVIIPSLKNNPLSTSLSSFHPFSLLPFVLKVLRGLFIHAVSSSFSSFPRNLLYWGFNPCVF